MYIHTYIHIHTYIYICMCIYMYICMCVYIYIYIYVCMYVCMYVCAPRRRVLGPDRGRLDPHDLAVVHLSHYRILNPKP